MMTKLIILIAGIICIFFFYSPALSDDSLNSTIFSPGQNVEETSFHAQDLILAQDETSQEPDESVDEPDQEQEPSDEQGASEEKPLHIADPLSPWNKGVFYFNDKFYFWLLKPAAQGYSAVFPEGVRVCFNNIYQNITTPIRFVNNLLQLKFKAAGNELIRLVVNSTLGVGGCGDFAKDIMEVKRHDEDAGLTFGHYGIGHGFYIVWPILGPSSLRDTVGLVGDLFLNPISYITPATAPLGIDAHKELNDTSFHIGEYEDMKKSAIDPYVSVRDAYVQARQKKVEE